MRFLPARQKEISRADTTISIDQYIGLLERFSFGGIGYSVPGPGMNYTAPGQRQEIIGQTFRSYSQLAYKSNGIVFACMLARMMLFSEARFQFRDFVNGRPGNLFGTTALQPLETPWAGARTCDLLKRAIQYADLAGNAFMVPRNGGITFLRPDWVSIIIGVPDQPDSDAWSVDAEVLGYIYAPGGYQVAEKDDIEFFTADEVAHFAPIPDPEARFRGMSWITPIIREVMADKAQTEHKLSFLENAATPNMIVKLDVPDLAAFEMWTEKFRAEHEGQDNAYKTLFLAAGADATAVGVDMKQLDFAAVQAGGENRIAAAAGVPPILIGLTDGLKASTYSNYQQARRHFADHTMRPLWGDFTGAVSHIIKVPGRSELWYDDRDITALQDDRKDAAVIKQTEAATIASYISAGFKADSVVAAVQAGDLNLLVHSGLFSVQLQKPDSQNQNGNQPTNGAVSNGATKQGA